jgi:hypothetical protein
LIPTGEQPSLQTHIATPESVFVAHADEKLTALVELESAIFYVPGCIENLFLSKLAIHASNMLIDSAGQLGTASSLERFKKEIKPMDKASEAILALKPVTFHYKSDKTGTPQFGLIAEEVAAVNPDLVVRDKDGEIYTVRYDQVNAMLLNEFLKEHSTVQELKNQVAVLTATVKEQAALIQKISAQVELNKVAPQTVLNNH